jgi:hypothetical protein
MTSVLVKVPSSWARWAGTWETLLVKLFYQLLCINVIEAGLRLGQELGICLCWGLGIILRRKWAGSHAGRAFLCKRLHLWSASSIFLSSSMHFTKGKFKKIRRL